MLSSKDITKIGQQLKKAGIADWKLIVQNMRSARQAAIYLDKKYNVKVSSADVVNFARQSTKRIFEADAREELAKIGTYHDPKSGLTFTGEQYIQARKTLNWYNNKAKMYNEYHKDEIAAGKMSPLPIKKWTLGPKDTQEGAEKWLAKLHKNYSRENYKTRRERYIDNVMLAIWRCFSAADYDLIEGFVREKLLQYVPKEVGNIEGHEMITTVYLDQRSSIDKLMRWLGQQCYQEWVDYKQQIGW